MVTWARWLLLGVLLLAGARASGETVDWINPAGGEFEDGGNWSTGTPPGPGDLARLALATAYTVTVSSDQQLRGLHISGGNVTLAMADRTVTLGTPLGGGWGLSASGAVRFEGGTIIIGGGNVSISGAPFVGVGNVITDKLDGGGRNSTATVGGVVHGATVVCRNTNVSGQLFGCGFGGERVYLGPGEMVGGAASGGEGTHVVQPLVLRGGARLRPGSQEGLRVHATVTVEDEGSQLDGLNGITAGTTTVRDGGRITEFAILNLSGQARLVLADGGTCGAPVWLTQNSSLRIEQGSVGPGSIGLVPGQNTGLELVVDGAASPAFVPRTVSMWSEGYAGQMRLEVLNPNPLRVGDIIPLLTCASALDGTFSGFTAPSLDGGRVVHVDVQPTQASIVIEAGGNPCWSADFDGDGMDGTDADIEAFFACLAGRCCALCGSVDFNSDGDTATDADIEGFFSVLSGGPC